MIWVMRHRSVGNRHDRGMRYAVTRLPARNAIDAKRLTVPFDLLTVCKLCELAAQRCPMEAVPPFLPAEFVIRPFEVGVGDVFPDLLGALVADELHQRRGMHSRRAGWIRVEPFDANAPAFGARFWRQAIAPTKCTGRWHQLRERGSASGGGHRFGRRIWTRLGLRLRLPEHRAQHARPPLAR